MHRVLRQAQACCSVRFQLNERLCGVIGEGSNVLAPLLDCGAGAEVLERELDDRFGDYALGSRGAAYFLGLLLLGSVYRTDGRGPVLLPGREKQDCRCSENGSDSRAAMKGFVIQQFVFLGETALQMILIHSLFCKK